MSEDDSVKHEGKWTRADLPPWDKIRDADDMAGNGLRSRVIDIALNEVVDHLNTHHPKPEQAVCAQSGDNEPMMPRETLRERAASDGRLWNQAYAEGVASGERTCNELRSLIEGQKEHVTKAQRERDDEKSRSEFFAKRADEAKRERDKWRAEWVAVSEDLKAARRQSDLAHEQWQKWEGRARRAESGRDAAVASAEQLDKNLAKVMSDYQDVEDECDELKKHLKVTEEVLDIERKQHEETSDNLVQANQRWLAAIVERDEWKARAEKAEADRENIAEEFADFRVEVVAEAVKYRESNPSISRDDIEKTVWDWSNRPTPHPISTDLRLLADELFALVSGTDPAVHVVRESDIAAVAVEQGNNWRANGTGIPKSWTAEQARGLRDQTAEQWCEIEAIARAIEAEQAVDPIEAKARELYEVGNPGTVGMWESIHEAFKDGYRRIARHVLEQEASDE